MHLSRPALTVSCTRPTAYSCRIDESEHHLRWVNETGLTLNHRHRPSKGKSTKHAGSLKVSNEDETPVVAVSRTDSTGRGSPCLNSALTVSQAPQGDIDREAPFPMCLSDNNYWDVLESSPEIPLSVHGQQFKCPERHNSGPALDLQIPGPIPDHRDAFWSSLHSLHRDNARSSFGLHGSDYSPLDLDSYQSDHDSSANDPNTVSFRIRLARRTGCLKLNKRRQWEFFGAMNPISLSSTGTTPLSSSLNDGDDSTDFDEHHKTFLFPTVDVNYEKYLTDLFFAWHNPWYNQIDEALYMEHRNTSPLIGDFYWSPALQKAM